MSDVASSELYQYTYEGVWKKYSEPAFRQWVWTVRDSHALLILACLTIILAFTQSRAWVIFRYTVLQWNRPIRLPDDHTPEPLEQLSQGKAITETFLQTGKAMRRIPGFWRRCLRRRTSSQDPLTDFDSAVFSPWFGVFAALNIMIFVTMGIVVPWFLSDGGLETPIVRSRLTERCLHSHQNDSISPYEQKLPKTDAVFAQCLDRLDEGCDSQYHLRQPQIQKTRLDLCPFPVDVCREDTKPFEITHWNMTAYELGLNSMSEMTISHRLTCAPVHFERFTYMTNKPPHKFVISAMNSSDESWMNFSMTLNTWNGPNALSKENSGLQMALVNGPHDLTVLPRYFPGIQRPDIVHSHIRRDDGTSFLVVYRAGAIGFTQKVDDPFFAASNQATQENGFRTFYADREATILGCFEQFQYCLPDRDYCGPWAARATGSQIPAMYLVMYAWPSLGHAKKAQAKAALMDMYTVFRKLPSMLSVFDYLAQRIEWHNMVPLSHSNFYFNKLIKLETTKEQWTVEVETWFMKGILGAILSVRDGALFQLSKIPEEKGNYLNYKDKRHLLCSRILFRNGAYTNINWIGFWVTFSTLVFICLISYSIKWIHKAGKALPGCLGTLLQQARRLKDGIGRISELIWNLLVRFLASALPLLNRRFRRASPQAAGSVQAFGMDNLQPVPPSQDGSNIDDNEEYGEIDNVI